MKGPLEIELRDRHAANRAKAPPGLEWPLQGDHGPARAEQAVGAPVRAAALPSLPPAARVRSGKLPHTSTGRRLPTTVLPLPPALVAEHLP